MKLWGAIKSAFVPHPERFGDSFHISGAVVTAPTRAAVIEAAQVVAAADDETQPPAPAGREL